MHRYIGRENSSPSTQDYCQFLSQLGPKSENSAGVLGIVLTVLHAFTWTDRVSQVALVVKNLPANARDIRDAGSIPGLGRSPGGGHSNPFQYSCLENPMNRGAWQVRVHGVTKNQTQLKWLSTQYMDWQIMLSSIFGGQKHIMFKFRFSFHLNFFFTLRSRVKNENDKVP